MAEPIVANLISSAGNLQSFSCVTCRQRKVKCDRHSPCTNCVRAEKQCSFVAPVRGRRKRTKPRKEGLHEKLKRYEELLCAYGHKVEPSDDADDGHEHDNDNGNGKGVSDLDRTSHDPDAATDSPGQDLHRLVSSKGSEPRLLTNKAASRYFDSAPWSNIGPQFHHPEVAGIGTPTDDLNFDESGMFFEPTDNSTLHDLTGVYPPLSLLQKIKGVYLDRFDPMMKILHMPSLWASIHQCLSQGRRLPKEEEAVMFAICLAAVTTLGEDECQSVLEGTRPALFSRYRIATRQALTNAGFMSTSSPMTLRAYVLFLTCVKERYRVDTIFVMSGIAIRIARRMGLHRDGEALGLLPFETEMRRRLWWHIVQIDVRLSGVLGTRPSLDACTADTKVPLNVFDRDLHPDMTEFPEERPGITEVTFCLVKCAILEVLRSFTPSDPGDLRWEALCNSDMTLAQKDGMIEEYEDSMEKRFLRYCDPASSLDAFVLITLRSGINKMRLFAHDPRQFAGAAGGGEVPQSERDLIFANAMKQLEYITLTRGGHQGLEKYMWHHGTNFLWNAILYALIEARRRRTGPEVDKVWELIGRVFSYYPQMFEESAGAVYKALGAWTLEVWGEYVAAAAAEGLPEPPAPYYITAIRQCRNPDAGTGEDDSMQKVRPATAGQVSTDGHDVLEGEDEVASLGATEPFTFPDLLTFNADPSEWEQWEQLLVDQDGTYRGMIF